MFWLKFSYLCAGQGKSANAVAKELGIPSGSITAWSKGAVPRNATLLKIAEYFSVSVDYLLSDNEKKLTSLSGSELTPAQQEMWDIVQSLSDEELERFVRVVKAMLGR